MGVMGRLRLKRHFHWKNTKMLPWFRFKSNELGWYCLYNFKATVHTSGQFSLLLTPRTQNFAATSKNEVSCTFGQGISAFQKPRTLKIIRQRTCNFFNSICVLTVNPLAQSNVREVFALWFFMSLFLGKKPMPCKAKLLRKCTVYTRNER